MVCLLSRMSKVRCAASVVAFVCFASSSAALRAQECDVVGDDIERAGDLFVALDAADLEDDLVNWLNRADDSIGDFIGQGAPVLEDINGISAVTLNSDALLDAYQSPGPAPEGLAGLDPTRSIEIWAFNPAIAVEETLVAWGRRGGPEGTNMSFNYGTHPAYGAVGQWGDGPDLGWNDGGGAPAAGAWHHLVYTYDGADTMTTRVYADGCEVAEYCNEEFQGAGVINTHENLPIVIGAQMEDDGVTLNFGLRGTLSVWRVRVHGGVLTPEQIATNYETELGCVPDVACECVGCPTADDATYRDKPEYKRQLTFTGTPPVDLVEVTSPAGGSIDESGQLTVPLDAFGAGDDSFLVSLTCFNGASSTDFSWTVQLIDPPELGDIVVAEELLVDLDAAVVGEVEGIWLNAGSAADFRQVGEPVAEDIGPEDSPAVSLNSLGATDAYVLLENAPAGLVGPDPTRSIEVWAFNPEITDEETMVAWGRRGGPDGTNMSFNYGSHPAYGAVGSWGGGPDLGWDDAGGGPEAGVWHHLVYTFDGDDTATTRVYVDGALQNSDPQGQGIINTHAGTPIVIGQQIVDAAGGLDFSPRSGVLSIGRVRVHDGVLSDEEVFENYCAEAELYGASCAPCPVEGDADYADTHATGLSIEETGAPLGVSHIATASAVDDTGDPILYTFFATDGVDTIVVGPQESNEASFVLGEGDWSFSVEVDDNPLCDDRAADAVFPPEDTGERFVRGDADSTGNINLNDGIVILNFLFLGFAPPQCMDAADADDSGGLLLNDSVLLFNWLFSGAAAPAAPTPSAGNYLEADCGADPTDSDALGCANRAAKCS